MRTPRLGRVIALLGALAIATAACGASATPTPAPTPTPTPAPTLAPTPTPVDVAAAFLEQVTATTSGRLPVTGTAVFGGLAATITGQIESSGKDDSASTMTIAIGGTKQVQESIRIGARKWTRQNGGVWILDPEQADSTKSLSAYLKTLTVLEDEGVEAKGTRALHHLVPPAGSALTPEALGLDPSIKDPVITVDFWAEDDGTPAFVSVGVSWNQASGGTTVPVVLAMDLDMSGLGAAATVVAPEGAWTGFTSKRFKYSMAYEEGWSVREETGADVYLMDGTPYVYVAPQGVKGYTLERFHDELVAYYEQKDVVARPAAGEDYVLGGTPAKILTFRFTNDAGMETLLIDALTVRGDVGWEVYLIQEQTGEAEARAYFDTFLSTFSFED